MPSVVKHPNFISSFQRNGELTIKTKRARRMNGKLTALYFLRALTFVVLRCASYYRLSSRAEAMKASRDKRTKVDLLVVLLVAKISQKVSFILVEV